MNIERDASQYEHKKMKKGDGKQDREEGINSGKLAA